MNKGLKKSGSKLKLLASNILQHLPRVRNLTMTVLSHAMHLTKTCTKMRKQTLLLLVFSVFLVMNLFFLNTISGQLLIRTNLHSYGTIQGVGGIAVYSDAGCNTPLSEVSWGSVTPGYPTSNVVYVKNVGSSPLLLSLETANWSPTNAPSYMTLQWNYNGQAIAPNQAVQIIFTLSVSQSVSGINSFNFDIVVTGSS